MNRTCYKIILPYIRQLALFIHIHVFNMRYHLVIILQIAYFAEAYVLRGINVLDHDTKARLAVPLSVRDLQTCFELKPRRY